jgi:protein-tyrosine phosphatase
MPGPPTGIERQLRLEGAENLRDIGGYASGEGRHTRWRTVFRSDSLHRLSAPGQAWLIQAGLRSVIDLRDNVDASEVPNVFRNSTAVRYRHIPIFETPLPDGVEPPSLWVGYMRMVHQRGDRIRCVVEALLEPEATPLVIQCGLGKDRTGLVIALLLAAVGVPDGTIVDDYALSSECLRSGPYLAEARERAERKGWTWQQCAELWDCPPRLMVDLLDHLGGQFGGVRQYLGTLGLTDEQLNRLEHLLVESSPDHFRW